MPNRMDSIVSQGMGKVKAVKARLHGLAGVFKTLTEQHGEVTALLERAKASDEKFTQLWPTIRRELLSHEKGEVREVYSVLRRDPETQALADQHDDEARDLEQLIEHIDTLEVGSPEQRAMFQQLIDLVTEHANEEESEIFPKAQEVLGKDQAEALDERFLATKKQLAQAL
jgi:hemerythrin superfamily protein